MHRPRSAKTQPSRESLAARRPVVIMAAMKKLEMAIDGMHCEACVAKIRDALDTVAGVQNSEVQVGSATVTFDDGQCGPKYRLERLQRPVKIRSCLN